MSLSDKIKNAKRGHPLFDDIPPERMHALKMRGRVASVIAQKRQQLGMNQSEFAKFCGVTQPMVSKWESGASNPSMTNLMALARLFGVEDEELLREAG